MYRFLGAVPSPQDDRDYRLVTFTKPLAQHPSEFEIIYDAPAKDQGAVGSCVAHSLAYTREIVEKQQKGTFNKFSVGFIYANRKETDLQEEGMIPREALSALVHSGAVYESLFPVNEQYPKILTKFEQVKDELLEQALPYRITAYCRLYNTSEIKTALCELGPVTACIPIYESFYKPDSDGTVPIPIKARETLSGYHEITILGWKIINGIPYWKALNSWGASWGKSGYFYMSYEFPIMESWSITDMVVVNDEGELILIKVNGVFAQVMVGLTKARSYAKENYSGHITLERKRDGVVLEEFQNFNWLSILLDFIKRFFN